MLRYVPPVAALGTAFVIQVVAVTDTVGGVLADRFGSPWLYAVGVLLGLSVASCAEGGAAGLMDLYDKHLLARDSVWVLRLGMVVYVAVSAGAIHWWTDMRGLPAVFSWLLAGMSTSALFLWSRFSRWRNREAMRRAGQLDPALPRLPMPAKIMHFPRWLVTLYLISWEPVATTAEARARYREWKAKRDGTASLVSAWVELQTQQAVFFAEAEADRILREATLSADAVRERAEQDAANVRRAADALSAEAARLRAEADSAAEDARRRLERATDSRPDRSNPVRLVASNGRRRTATSGRSEVSVEELADTLGKRFPDSVPGRLKVMEYLSDVHGSCSTERARLAMKLLSDRRVAREADSDPDSDQERQPVGASA